MKISFNPKMLEKNPKKIFKTLSNQILQNSKKKKEVDTKSLYAMLAQFGDVFEKSGEREMNSLATNLAQRLVNLGNNNLSGIIYSFLIKFNKNNPAYVEELATNALAIAKRTHDQIHIMARTNDLKNIYAKTEYGSEKHLKTLYAHKRSLKQIITNYDGCEKRYQTMSRRMQPKENYELKYCKTVLEIARITKDTEPKQTLQELLAAKEIISAFPAGKASKQIDYLINELNKTLQTG
jgi:hypothetical protein